MLQGVNIRQDFTLLSYLLRTVLSTFGSPVGSSAAAEIAVNCFTWLELTAASAARRLLLKLTELSINRIICWSEKQLVSCALINKNSKVSLGKLLVFDKTIICFSPALNININHCLLHLNCSQRFCQLSFLCATVFTEEIFTGFSNVF